MQKLQNHDSHTKPGVSHKPALVFSVKHNSLDDGPGIRSVVFFKGCPLSCAWCHNREGMRPGPELSHDPGLCVACHACHDVCQAGALDHATLARDPVGLDRTRCTLCLECAAVCPSGALSRVGMPLDVDRLVADILRYKPFFDFSGGGATLSGGEPTLFMDQAGLVARSLRDKGIPVLLETCGFFDTDRFLATLYPFLDAIYMDIKIMDRAEHKRLCGADNRPILDNFRELNRRAQNGGAPVLARVPLVPGMTDTSRNLCAIADFLRHQNVHTVTLLPYNPLWTTKPALLGQTPPADPALSQWMSPEHLAACRDCFHGFNLSEETAC